MKQYNYPNLLFTQAWYWFADPHEVSGADLAVFFSYHDCSEPGFRKRAGLTSIIDLAQPLDDIWAAARKNFVRKQIERGRRNGISVRQDSNFADFKPIYASLRKNKSLGSDSYRVLEKNGLLFSAYHDNEMIAGGIFIVDGEHMRAWVLASRRFEGDARSRELVGQANRMVMWEAIAYAHQNGYKLFDVGGIMPDSPDPSRRAVAEFKEAFGGQRTAAYFYRKTYSPWLRRWLRWRRTFTK